MKKTKRFFGVMLVLVCILALNASSMKTLASPQAVATVTSVDTAFDLWGGVFTVSEWPYGATDNYRSFYPANSTLRAQGFTCSKPVFWDGQRAFLGWQVKDSNFTLIDSNIYTTEQLYDYVFPEDREMIIFSAKWEGDNWDYYSEVMLDGFGGLIPMTIYESSPGVSGLVSVEKQKDSYENYSLKENGVSIAEQTEKDYSLTKDPVKTGAIFEGWLEFSYENVEYKDASNFELVSEKLYTTDEITKREVPEYNVAFVAKWSDVPMATYYTEFRIAVPTYNTEIKTELATVPAGITEKYESVDDLKNEMVSVALNSNEAITSNTATTVFMDVELQIRNADGQLETVTYENFPIEGVEVVLPYPEGTNQDSFNFVISHMITAGSRAGEVEILDYTLVEEGIKVKFTSMSPVAITYQEKAAVSETNTTSPQTADTTPVVLYAAVMMVGLAALLVSYKAKKVR